MAHLPLAGENPAEIRQEDVKAFFESIDETWDSTSRSVHNDNRIVLEQRLRRAVGLTMPSHRFK